MQITLNQDEIETALRRYVNDQVNIRDGHEITIDLKAGRGENGFTATIDIVPQGTAKTPEVTSPPKPVTIPRVRGVTQPAQIPDAQETAQEAAGEAAAEPATPPPAEAGQVEGDGQEAEQQDGEGDGTPPETTEKPKSLFANLGKPKNV